MKGHLSATTRWIASSVTTSARTMSLRTNLLLVAALCGACSAVLLIAPVMASFAVVVSVSAAWCAWIEGEHE